MDHVDSFVIVGKANGKTKYIRLTEHDGPMWFDNFNSATIFTLNDARGIIHGDYFQKQIIDKSSGQKIPSLAISELCDFDKSDNKEIQSYEIYLAKIELQQCIYRKNGTVTKID